MTVEDKTKERMKAYSAAYRAVHKDKAAADNAAYYAAHAEGERARSRAYYAANKEKKAARFAAYHEAHKEELNTKHARYRAANRDKYRAISIRRRARKMQAEGTHTVADIKDQYARQKGKCFWCGKRVGKQYHVDHVVPLSRGGGDGPDNLVISCPTCNCRKGEKLPHEWAEGGRLI